MPFDLWSKTASLNSSIDPTINLAEGMAPSAVNDSCRAIMARLAEFRDDTSGLLTTAGTATAYTLASNQGFPTIPPDGQLIAFTPHTTNGIASTLTADGGTTYPIQTTPGVAVSLGSLVQGTPYSAKFSLSNLAWILFGFYANPFNIPLASGMDYWGSSVPNSNFAFPAGQAISRTTYAALFALIGITYGGGDGSTTFNLPDKTGRVSAMKEAVATRLTTAGSGVDGATLGAAGGLQTETLTLAQLPTGITSANAAQAISVTTGQKVVNGPNAGSAQGGGTQVTASDAGSGGALSLLGSSGNNAISVTSSNTSGNAHPNVQPTIVSNYIMRIL